MTIPQWLEWAQRLQAIAQTGNFYASSPFDLERYEQILRIAAEMVAQHSTLEMGQALDLMGSDQGHATPKIDSRAVIFKDDRILLAEEKMDNYRWTLPGGWVDIGESLGQAVEREAWEETGYRVKAVKLLALYDRNKHDHPPHLFHIYKAFFLCELLSEERNTAANLETGRVEFFPLDGLPELSVGRVTSPQIARFFEHRQHPEWPTDFD